MQLFANQYQQNIDIVQTAFDKLNSSEIALLNKWEKTGDYAEMGKFAIDKLKVIVNTSQPNIYIYCRHCPNQMLPSLHSNN